MFPTPLKTFVQPQSVYRLECPAHWDQVVQKEGESCGFGPHERDDVGLWISVMPMSIDTDRLVEDLPKLFEKTLDNCDATNLRQDKSLQHFGLIADMTREGEGGHYWLVAGGDVVLFASSQVPAQERDVWNPPFARLMASLQITRDDELLFRKLANEVLGKLKERHPGKEFTFDKNDKIRGPNQLIYLGNLFREVRTSPDRKDEIVQRFVTALSQPATADLGHEQWPEVATCVMPVLKHRNYIKTEGPTQHMHTREWLADVIICYAINRKKMIRFITGWDLRRWEIDENTLHEQALTNLAASRWPRQLPGARVTATGHVIVIDTDDGLGSSRLLHPELHKLFAGPLGSPFWAGVPCRDRLVVFSDRKVLKQRIGRRLRKDHDSSAYAITPHPFLVTRDGIAPQQ
jgi:uncharacterized protein YtpQ (UPF0354 family)